MPQTYSLSFGPEWMRPKNPRSSSESNSAKHGDAQDNAIPEDASSNGLHSSTGDLASQVPRRKNPKSPWTSSRGGDDNIGRETDGNTKSYSSSNGLRSYRNASSSDAGRPARGSPFPSWSSTASNTRNNYSRRNETKLSGEGMTDQPGFHESSASEHTSAETEANKKLINSLLREPQLSPVPVQPDGKQYSPEEMLRIWSVLRESGDIDRYIPASLTSDDSASSVLSSQSSHLNDPPDTDSSTALPAQLFRKIKSDTAQSPVLLAERNQSIDDDDILPPDHVASSSLAFMNSPQQTEPTTHPPLSSLDTQDPFDPSFRATSRTQDQPHLHTTTSLSHHPFSSGLGRLDTQSPSLSSPWATSPFAGPNEIRGIGGSDLFQQQPGIFGSGSRPLSRSTSQGPELFSTGVMGLGSSGQPFANDAPIPSPGIHHSRILPSSISRTATPLQQNQSQQAPPGLSHPSLKSSITDLLVGPEHISWLYKDSAGNEQGPFNGKMMHEWFVNNWLQEDLPIRREEQEDFIPLGTFKLQVGSSTNPFLVPLPPITRSLATGGSNGGYPGSLAPGSPMSAGFATIRSELQSQVSGTIPVETIADAWNTVLGRSNAEIEQQQQQQETRNAQQNGHGFQPEPEPMPKVEPVQERQETTIASITDEVVVEEKLEELQIEEQVHHKEAAPEREIRNNHSVWDDITPKYNEVEENIEVEEAVEQDNNNNNSAWGDNTEWDETTSGTSVSAAVPASVAPWADQSSTNKKVPSLKEIQEREAATREKAKKANKFQSNGTESRPDPRSAANVVSAALFLGQNQPASSPSSSLPNTAAWARPSTTPAPTPRKTLQQIQKEEEDKRKVRAQTASSSASNPISAAAIASRMPTFSAARVASSSSSNSPWVTVTNNKKSSSNSGTAPTVGAPSAVPGAAVRTATRPSNGTVKNTRVIPSGATLQPSASKDEFLKWCNSSIKDLRSSIKKQDLISMFLSLPLDSRESNEIVSEAIYASSTTMDGRRFASEFMKKRAAVEGSGRTASSATSGSDQSSSKGGWSDVLSRQPEPVNDGWNPVVKLVGKKKSRKAGGGES